MLGGSTALTEEAAGIYSGDLSGIAVKTLPFWARRRETIRSARSNSCARRASGSESNAYAL
jgi:hypothetical protein